MAIKEEFRGIGIGQKLLNELFNKIKSLSIKQVSLSADKRNLAYEFYKKNGFIEVDSEKKSIN